VLYLSLSNLFTTVPRHKKPVLRPQKKTGLSHLQRTKSLQEEEVKEFVRDYADRDGDGFLS